MTPYLLAMLLDRANDRVVFIKQESLVLGDLRETVSTLPPGGIALTPHILAPLASDDVIERELTILLAGTFNGGLVAVAEGETSRSFLKWWQERVYSHCLYEVAAGMHYEQRWLDLVPGYFETTVLHDPASTSDIGICRNVGSPSRTERSTPTVIVAVCSDSAATTRTGRNRRRATSTLPASRSRGSAMPRSSSSDIAKRSWLPAGQRRALGRMPTNASTTVLRYPTSFETSTPVSPTPNASVTLSIRKDRRASFAGCRKPTRNRKGPSHLWYGVYQRRADLQSAFPDVFGRHSAGFRRWTHDSAAAEYGIPRSSSDVAADWNRRGEELLAVRARPRTFLRRHHPDARFVVALSDELDGHVDRSAEPFPIITPGELGVPDLQDLAFRSGQRELAIALKPYLIEHMAADAGSALFLDADTLVVGDLEPLFDSVQRHALTLVPHRLAPPATDGVARDLVLNLAGIFNGGVVGIRHQASSTDFVRWWQARVHQLCVYAVDRGIHYDQRWLDLALGFVEDLHIHRDPGVNVAHWNLPERPIRIRDGAITAAGEPCRLFHFSGFDPDDPKTPSRYRPDLRLDDVGEAARLFGDYARELDREGWPIARRMPYAYGSFDNGVPIPKPRAGCLHKYRTARSSAIHSTQLRGIATSIGSGRVRHVAAPFADRAVCGCPCTDSERISDARSQIDSTQTVSAFWRGGARDAQLRTPSRLTHLN